MQKDHAPNSQDTAATRAAGQTPHRQAASPSQPRWDRLAVVAGVLLVAVSAGWGGWHLFKRAGQPGAARQADNTIEAVGAPTPSHGIRNIVLVSIDTCRADRLSCYGFKHQTTPNIDALAGKGAF